jgi:hypothetical protein
LFNISMLLSIHWVHRANKWNFMIWHQKDKYLPSHKTKGNFHHQKIQYIFFLQLSPKKWIYIGIFSRLWIKNNLNAEIEKEFYLWILYKKYFVILFFVKKKSWNKFLVIKNYVKSFSTIGINCLPFSCIVPDSVTSLNHEWWFHPPPVSFTFLSSSYYSWSTLQTSSRCLYYILCQLWLENKHLLW